MHTSSSSSSFLKKKKKESYTYSFGNMKLSSSITHTGMHFHHTHTHTHTHNEACIVTFPRRRTLGFWLGGQGEGLCALLPYFFGMLQQFLHVLNLFSGIFLGGNNRSLIRRGEGRLNAWCSCTSSLTPPIPCFPLCLRLISLNCPIAWIFCFSFGISHRAWTFFSFCSNMYYHTITLHVITPSSLGPLGTISFRMCTLLPPQNCYCRQETSRENIKTRMNQLFPSTYRD